MDDFHALPEADAEARNERRTELVAQLHELTADEVPPDVLPALAENAFQLGDRLLGIQLYRRLGTRQTPQKKPCHFTCEQPAKPWRYPPTHRPPAFT